MSAEVRDVTAETQPTPVRTLGGIIPYLQVDGASTAAGFYQRAFGAVEVARHPLDEQGRTMHIHLHLNEGSLMLSDSYPEYGHPLEKPQAFNLTLQVKDIDAWWNRAVAAGATVVMPIERMFWGDRYGQLRDPFGVLWSLNEPSQKAE
jgi:PhnB protein